MHPVEASTARTTGIRKGKVNVCVWFGQKKRQYISSEGCLLQFSNVALCSRIGKMFSHELMNFKG